MRGASRLGTRLVLGALVLLAGVLPVGAQAQPPARSATAIVQYAGRAGFFVGSPLQYRMVRAGEQPFAPAYPYPEIVESSAKVQVDDVAGTATGTVVLAYRTLSTYGFKNGQTTYPGGTCTVLTRETSVLKSGTFNATTRSNVSGKRDYSYQRVVEGFQRTPGAPGSGSAADCAWDPFTIERVWQGRWDDANYPTGNDDPAFAGKKYLSLYGSDVYEFLGRAFRDVEVQPKVPWLLMAYLDADTGDGLLGDFDAILRRYEMAAANKNVRIAVLLDRGGAAGATYYEVQPTANVNTAPAYQEGKTKWARGAVNMADPATLAAFAAWARERYPADRTGLVIANHGSGLGGGMVDLSAGATSGDQLMTLPKMATGLAAVTSHGARKLDVLYLDMCLMGMLEVAYQIKDYASFVVASENELFFNWDHNRRYAAAIGPTTSAASMAQLIGSTYAAGVSSFNRPYTIAVWDLSKLDALVAATNTLAQRLDAKIPKLLQDAEQTKSFNLIVKLVQRFDSTGDMALDGTDAYIDLGHFAQLLEQAAADPNHFEDPELAAAARAVGVALKAFVPFEAHGTGTYQGKQMTLGNSSGVAVFFPPTPSSFYSGDNYTFAAGTTWKRPPPLAPQAALPVAWGPMLATYFRLAHPNAPDDPTPPVPLALSEMVRVFAPAITRSTRP